MGRCGVAVLLKLPLEADTPLIMKANKVRECCRDGVMHPTPPFIVLRERGAQEYVLT
jgi:hypothetical protein